MTVDEPPVAGVNRACDKSRQIAKWFLVTIACGLAWRVVRFGLYFELTGDESGIMRSVMDRGYAALLAPLSYSNVSPPLFLWMTKFLDSLCPNEWAVRIVPFLAGLGAVALVGMICREILQGTACWLAWAVFCVAYVPVVEGTRVKGYTIDLFVAALMLWLMLRWLLHGRKARYLAALCLCAPVFVWLSYTAVFIVGAVGFVLAGSLLKQSPVAHAPSDNPDHWNWKNLLAGLIFVVVAGISVLLLYHLNVRPGLQASLGNGLADAWQRGYPPDQPWKFPLWLLTAQTGRGFAWPIGDNHFRSTLTFALWLTGLVVYWRRGQRWVWALFVAPQALALAAAILHKYPYLQNPRLCLFLAPGICLFVGLGAKHLIDKTGDQNARRWHWVAAFALALCALGGMARDIVLRVREMDGPGIRSTLVAAGRRVGAGGQFVVLNDAAASGVFSYYIKRKVKQTVWYNGQVPPHPEPGRRLALVAVDSKTSDPAGSPLFGEFEKRLGRPLKVQWLQAAHEVLLDNKDSLVVWVCEY
jgi:hypothetical protein